MIYPKFFHITKLFHSFFELDLFSHSLAASWSFLTKKSEVSFFSGPGPALSTLTQLGSDCHITGNQIIFADEKFTIFH
jgi:hypothetical protein